MTEAEFLRQTVDTGLPFTILVVIALAVRRVWSSIWPWWRDVYWPAREGRWQVLQQETAAREARYQKLVERYENGHRAQTKEEHSAIIREIREMGNTVAAFFQKGVADIGEWHKDTIRLIAVSEQRHTALEEFLREREVTREH